MAGTSFSGETPVVSHSPGPTLEQGYDPFDRAIRPITNPTIFDLALPRTQLRPIVIHNNLPNRIDTTLSNLELGGDFQVYATRFS